MKVSKARAAVVERGTFLHVDPRTGARVESAHEWLVFPNNPAMGPLPMSQARTINAENASKTAPRTQLDVRAPSPPKPPSAPEPARAQVRRPAGAIRSAEEARAMTVRQWTPARGKP